MKLSENVNQLFEVFFSKCSGIVNKHLPLRKLSHGEVKFNSKPWITKALRQLRKSINHKNTLYQRAKKFMSDSPGLVDFAIGLVNSVLNLPDGQAKIFRRIRDRSFFTR